MPVTAAEVPQTLLIDADDTLWENNRYFEQAIANFITFLDHKEHSREQVREVLNQVERESIATHGYGLHSFAHSLVTTFERLAVEPVAPETHAKIWSFAHFIAEHPMELIDGVPETLAYLSARGHRMILLTKGNPAEQTGKVERSGLRDYFTAVEIVAEKHRQAYAEIAEKYALLRETTWMVGNSPKSDINPAIAAGLNAIFVPHDMTWVLEHETIEPPPEGSAQKLLVLEGFRQLQQHF